MKKKSKRALYKTLRQLYGDPTNLSLVMRREIATVFGGWLLQHEVPASVVHLRQSLLVPGREGKATTTTLSKAEKIMDHARRAHSHTPKLNWHWKIVPRIYPPKGVKDMRASWSDRRNGKTYIGKTNGKTLELVFPINYHINVPSDIRVIDRKIIQSVTNHRVYSDKETWECAYYDLSGLGKEEATWTKAKWREGYLVKMATGMAAEQTLSRAIKLATGRTIRSSVRSILRDHEQ